MNDNMKDLKTDRPKPTTLLDPVAPASGYQPPETASAPDPRNPETPVAHPVDGQACTECVLVSLCHAKGNKQLPSRPSSSGAPARQL